jgi:hypothetical protein
VLSVRYELGSYIPEDGILHSHHSESLKAYTTLLTLQRKAMLVFFPLKCGPDDRNVSKINRMETGSGQRKFGVRFCFVKWHIFLCD